MEATSSLIIAAQEGELSKVALLVSQGASIPCKQNLALIEAAKRGRLNVVKYLLAQGIDSRDTLLHVALWEGRFNIVRYLISLARYSSHHMMVERCLSCYDIVCDMYTHDCGLVVCKELDKAADRLHEHRQVATELLGEMPAYRLVARYLAHVAYHLMRDSVSNGRHSSYCASSS